MSISAICVSYRIGWVSGLVGILAVAILIGHFGLGGPLVAALGLTLGLWALARVDWQQHRLPDRLTLPLLWVGLGVNLFGTFAPIEAAVLGAMGGYGILRGAGDLYRWRTGRTGIGRGDAKLVAALGAWLGWEGLPWLLAVAAGLHALLVGASILFAGQGWRTPQPAGPSFALAGWAALMWGQAIP